MPDKLRSVNTKFWDDPFIDELDTSQKLLFLYLLTNPLTNLLGVYEITLKRISSDTGLKNETILNGLERFGRVKKAFYINNYMILPNWLKNQSLNSNMKIAVSRQFLELPKELQDNILGNGSEGFINGSEGFKTILECLGKYEIEIEREIEIEDDEKNVFLFSSFWDSYHSITSLKKTDNEATLKYWKKLTEQEKKKAIENIKPYYDSLSDKKYCKKARTYLSDKNFNDEFSKVKQIPIIPDEDKLTLRSDFDPTKFRRDVHN